MQTVLAAALLGLATIAPVAAQTSSVQQMLQGLFTGDQKQDRALQEAYERGYQRGRDDESRQRQASGRYNRGDDARDANRYGDNRSRSSGDSRLDPSNDRYSGSGYGR
jgi:hypothetical protein